MEEKEHFGPSQFVFYNVDITYKQDPVVKEKAISIRVRFLSGSNCSVPKTLD